MRGTVSEQNTRDPFACLADVIVEARKHKQLRKAMEQQQTKTVTETIVPEGACRAVEAAANRCLLEVSVVGTTANWVLGRLYSALDEARMALLSARLFEAQLRKDGAL